MDTNCRILVISTVLPLPGHIDENPIVLKLYKELTRRIPFSVTFVRPVPRAILGLSLIRKCWRRYRRIKATKLWVPDQEVWVHVVRILSMRTFVLDPILLLMDLCWQKNRIKKFVERFSLVHANYLFPDGLIAWFIHKVMGIPYLLTIRAELGAAKTPVKRMFALLIIRNAAAIVTQNYLVRTELEKCFDARQDCVVIPHGVDDTFYREECRYRQPKDCRTPRILSVGQLIPRKNIDKVLQALSLVAPGTRFDYRIVGAGELEEQLRKQSAGLGLIPHVGFLGKKSREEVAEIMLASDIFVLPSYPETFGIVFAEAMASGLPIICAHGAGIQGHFREGVDGVSVDPHDTDQIAKALIELLGDPERCRRMGRDAREQARNFRWEVVVDRYVAILTHILQKE